MIELGVRILISGLLLFFAGATNAISFEVAMAVAIAFGGTAAIAHQLEAAGKGSDATRTAFALLDACLIAIVLSAMNASAAFGLLTLVPIVIATQRYGATACYAAPLGGLCLLIASQIVHPGYHVSDSVLSASGAIFVIGVALAGGAMIAARAEADAAADPAESDFILLREKYRRLEDSYEQLRQVSMQDRMLSSVAGYHAMRPTVRVGKVIERLSLATEVRGMVLLAVTDNSGELAVRGHHGAVPELLLQTAISVDMRTSIAMLQTRVSKAIQPLVEELPFECVPLVANGRVLGFICMITDDSKALEDARRTISTAATQLAEIISDSFEKCDLDRRAREAELLYSLATLSRGSDSTIDVCGRFVAELRELVGADQVAIYSIDGSTTHCLAETGGEVRVLDQMEFAHGMGIDGWRRLGRPEVLLNDAKGDKRVPRSILRIGSYYAVPIATSDFEGFVCASARACRAFDATTVEIMRTTCDELGRAIDRVEADSAAGIMTVAEMQETMAGSIGSVVVFEVLRRNQIESSGGKAAFRSAVRMFIRRVANRMPAGGGVARNEKGQVVVFLPDIEEAEAALWANEIEAIASMIGVRGPTGTKSPMAVRSKVAGFNPQNSQFSEKLEV